MTRVFYMVGRNDYYTRCNTMADAEKQKSLDSKYEIKTCYEDIPKDKPKVSPIRAKLLEDLGMVPPIVEVSI